MAARIRRSRTDAGLSQAALAERLGIQRAAVTQWEHPQDTMPTLQHLMRLAVETGVAIEWLACGRGPMRLEGAAETPAFNVACVARDEHEEGLLAAYRGANHRQRAAMLELVRALVGQASA